MLTMRKQAINDFIKVLRDKLPSRFKVDGGQ